MMSIFFASLVYLEEKERRKVETVKRRILRDHSNPLDMSETTFVTVYRINKEAFKMILAAVKPIVKETSIPLALTLAATLRFLAEGGYQRAIGRDASVAVSRSVVSRMITKMLSALEKSLCTEWIKLQMGNEDINLSKRYFYEKFKVPGVIGCIDGTHVKITKPWDDEHLYFNRKGNFSINVMVICDYKMMIRSVDACHPGASHDSFVFNMSRARQYMVTKYEGGERNSWLLGDSGYGIEPFLMTPYRDPVARSPQHYFNIQHAKARNIVERVIGVLKSRFKCLQTTLPYHPVKVVKITNVCCALHNICRHYNIEVIELVEPDITDPVTLSNEESTEGNATQLVGRNIRDSIANNLVLNM